MPYKKGDVLKTEKTLLDEFAMAALTGLIAKDTNDNTPEQNISSAWGAAKAMMEERKKYDQS